MTARTFECALTTLAILAFSFVVPMRGFSQVAVATISGTVRNSAGTTIPDAHASIGDAATNVATHRRAVDSTSTAVPGARVTARNTGTRTATHAATRFDLQTATVADINAAIDAGALSSEKLVGLYLNRIEAYDKKGPKINSVITLNPRALEEARALDAERKTKGRRSPLHGIPVVVKDLVDVPPGFRRQPGSSRSVHPYLSATRQSSPA